MEPDSQTVWAEYVQRKRAARLAEAEQVWSALVAGGADAETVLAIDFVHFGPSKPGAEKLAEQLAENCTVALEDGPDGYWLIKGTTRPYGVTLSAEDHLAWVDFMCEVSASHGCVFSTWSLSAPTLDLSVQSEAFECGG